MEHKPGVAREPRCDAVRILGSRSPFQLQPGSRIRLLQQDLLRIIRRRRQGTVPETPPEIPGRPGQAQPGVLDSPGMERVPQGRKTFQAASPERLHRQPGTDDPQGPVPPRNQNPLTAMEKVPLVPLPSPEERLKLRKDLMGLTIKQAAHEVGVSPRTIWRWEHGQDENMRPENHRS